MDKRENCKVVTIKERQFRIGKFDARTGSYMLIKVVSLFAPMLKGLTKLEKVKSPDEITLESIDISQIAGTLSSLSEDDFNYVQGKCLGVCYELLEGAGPTPIINDNGSYGVMDIETDTMLIMALTAHALMFNVTGFFEGSPLASMVGTALTSFQSSVKM